MKKKTRSSHAEGAYDFEDYIASMGVKLRREDTNSDWAGSAVDQKSTSGCCFSMGSL
jgi:hypothetical protein